MKQRKLIAVIAPEECVFFKKGKRYEVIRMSEITSTSFIIINEFGRESYCRLYDCAYLNFGDWIPVYEKRTPKLAYAAVILALVGAIVFFALKSCSQAAKMPNAATARYIETEYKQVEKLSGL